MASPRQTPDPVRFWTLDPPGELHSGVGQFLREIWAGVRGEVVAEVPPVTRRPEPIVFPFPIPPTPVEQLPAWVSAGRLPESAACISLITSGIFPCTENGGENP